MRALVGVEVRRFLARRLVRVVAGLAVVGIVTGCTVLFVRSHRLDAASLTERQQQAQAVHNDQVRQCAAGEFGVPPSEVPPGQSLEQYCEELVGEPIVQDPAYHLVDLRGALVGINGLLITLSLLLGASFVGAEWHAGTMATLLTWEPRRVRVVVTKIAIAAGMAFVGTLALQAVLSAGLLVVAAFRGTTAGTDAAWIRDVIGVGFRAAAVSAIAATIGAALASLGRNTAAALGIAFGYLAVAEPLLRGWRPQWGRWFLSNNTASFLDGARSPNPEFLARSPGLAGLQVTLYAVALAAVAVASFRARDVT